MAVPRYFSECPPFPSDVPVIDLAKISLSKLEKGSGIESKKVFDACRRDGFFLLDLQGCDAGQELLDDAERLYDLTEATFSLSQEELDKFAYNPKVSLFGYKRSGLLKTDDGGQDCTDLYTISQDDILGTEIGRSYPEPIERSREQSRAFLLHAHKAVSLVLLALEAHTGLPKGTFESLTALDKPSQTGFRILRTAREDPPSPTRRITLGQHTDIGLATFLFNGAGGLQMLPPGVDNLDANWRYIRPQPGCALINLGDTLVELTGGLFRSGLHRVVTAPGGQNCVARRSFGYFLRPAREATMQRLGDENTLIPQDTNGHVSRQPVDAWAVERAGQIIRGELKPQSFGGSLQVQAVA